MTNSKKNILFCLTGSIAAYKACQVISRLVQSGYDVQAAVTPAALEFVGKATLEGLTGRAVFSDVAQAGRMMDHIHLSTWATLTIVCPATANTLNRLSAGLADDAVGALALTHDFSKPLLIVPAMNYRMYTHPATQASLKKLEGYGARVLPTGDGHQACGDVGPGRMLEPDEIFAAIQNALNPTKILDRPEPLELA